MPLARGLVMVAVLVALGCLQVAQRNALLVKGYRVGSLTAQVHAQETQLALRRAEVAGMASPQALARAAAQRHLKLVAWETVDHQPPGLRVAAAAPDADGD